MRLPAYPVYLIMRGSYGLFWWTIVTVNLVYHVETVGMSPLQLVLVGTVLEAAYFAFEIPTGVVADAFSRRLSVIIGMILIGAGFVLEGAIPLFISVLLAQVVWGIGAAFTSGAQEAWIAGEVGEKDAGRAILRGAQVERIGGLAGIPISIALASIHIQIPIVLGGGLIVMLGVFLMAVMPERGFSPAARGDRATWASLARIFRDGSRLARRRPAVMTILAVGLFYGMFGEGIDRLSTAHFLQTLGLPDLGRLKPVVWFGIIEAVAAVLGIAVTEVARRRLVTSDDVAAGRWLLGLSAALVAAVVGFGLAGSFALGLAAYWTINAIRQATDPILAAWLTQHTEPRTRATVFSMRGQVDALGQIGGGPIIGAAGTLGSLRLAFVVAAIILSPVMLLYARTLKRPVAAE